MAHTDKRIAEIEAELALLRADQASENAANNAPRPQGINPTWQPITFRRGQSDWVVIGWLDPAFEVSAFTRESRGGQAPGGPPITPPGPP